MLPNRTHLLVALTLSACTSLPPSNQPVPVRGAVWPDEGPATWTERGTRAPITANDLRTRLYQFADDSMKGRRIGEEGNFKGTEYIAREFRRLGLRPGGDSGTYFQTLPWGSMAFDANAMNLAIAGRALAPRTDWVPIATSNANPVSVTASINDVPTVFGGSVNDTTALDPATFGGKIVVLSARAGMGLPAFFGGGGGGAGSPPALPACESLPDRFGAQAAVIADAAAVRADSLAGRGRFAPPGPRVVTMRDVLARAQRAGARGIVLVSMDSVPPTALAAVMRQSTGMRPTPQAGALPAASITRRAAESIFGASVETLRVGATGQPLTASWSYGWTPSRWAARNVIAILPGSDPARAGEYVLVGAHNDHVGTSPVGFDHDSMRVYNTVTRRQGANDRICRPSASQQQRIDSMLAHARSVRPAYRDSIFNGADDDGSGTVVLLEVAEQFAAERPARSIIFVSHQGEEAGLLGSQWFVNHPTIPLAQVVAAINMDMVGKGRVEHVKFGGPTSLQILGSRRVSREFGDVIDSVNAVRAEVMAIDKTWEHPSNPMNRFCRSDQVSYVTKDVPVAYFSLGYSPDYHQVTDDPKYVDYDHSAVVGRFVHDVMAAVANRQHRLSRSDPDLTMPRCGR